VEGVVLSADRWDGRRVLLTGHTGFKGAWLAAWLDCLGASVVGLSLPPDTEPNLWDLIGGKQGIRTFEGDVRDAGLVARVFDEARPEVVLHLAAQSLVRRGYRRPAETFETNVMGTVNVLDAALRCPTASAVLVVTSDKVYANVGDGAPHGEAAPLGGQDPYSASKACTEIVVEAYRASFFHAAGIALATARAGNVIGGGDWAPDRVVPDVVRMLAAGTPVALRYPDATRPWQHVLDPLHGYLRLADRMATEPAGVPPALNFGPPLSSCIRVRDVVERLSACWDGRPGWYHDPAPALPEQPALALSSSLAADVLGWRPVLPLDDALTWTAEWYAGHHEGRDMASFTGDQIERFMRRAG
jgi:CDP-glucose 4,6-dehydratase